MKKLMILMILSVMITATTSYAAFSIEKVTVVPYHTEYDADGNVINVPATKLYCAKPSGGVTAGDCNWDLYNRTYHPVTTCSDTEPDDDEDDGGVAKGRSPWHN